MSVRFSQEETLCERPVVSSHELVVPYLLPQLSG